MRITRHRLDRWRRGRLVFTSSAFMLPGDGVLNLEGVESGRCGQLLGAQAIRMLLKHQRDLAGPELGVDEGSLPVVVLEVGQALHLTGGEDPSAVERWIVPVYRRGVGEAAVSLATFPIWARSL
ncbi:hypothetical protein [Streptomyces sp. NPDC002463]|uniref:hypothetical protein n=1 Tax=Streptomyces sp. NPDC002463 TaxID=3364645 RepID=UPI0036A972A5